MVHLLQNKMFLNNDSDGKCYGWNPFSPFSFHFILDFNASLIAFVIFTLSSSNIFFHLRLLLMIAFYFHSHAFSEKFPSMSISLSKTPTILLRNASLPAEDVLKNMEPRHFTLPEELNLPIPSPVYVTISGTSPPPAAVIITPFPKP